MRFVRRESALPRFFYEVLDTDNSSLEGVMEAATLEEAEKVLNRRYLMITELKPLDEVEPEKLSTVDLAPPEPPPEPEPVPLADTPVTPAPRLSREALDQLLPEQAERLRAVRVPPLSLALFARRMAGMMEAGIPAHRALHLLAQTEENRRMRAVLLQVNREMEGGRAMTASMQEHPEVFSPLFLNLVKSGEETGTLEQNMYRLGQFLDTSLRLQNRFLSALAYPLVLGATALFVATLFALIVVPQMKELLTLTGATPPFFTLLLVGMVDITAVETTWSPLLIVCATLLLALALMMRSEAGRRRIDRLLLSLPVVGDLLLKASSARMLHALATLLESGTPVGPHLALVGKVSGNQALSARFREAVGTMMTGKSMFIAFHSVDLFPASVLQMVRVGEESGALVKSLREAARMFEEEVDLAVDNLADLAEPLVLGIVGFWVLLISLALGLPTIDLLKHL